MTTETISVEISEEMIVQDKDVLNEDVQTDCVQTEHIPEPTVQSVDVSEQETSNDAVQVESDSEPAVSISINVSDTNDTVKRSVDASEKRASKLLRNIFLETLYVWLIIFDYSVIFPTKVFINRAKDSITGYIITRWTRFAERCAKFDILIHNHPEFLLLIIVLLTETLMLARNLARTVRCAKRMFELSKVRPEE